MKPKLSILICSLTKRHRTLNELMRKLKEQKTDRVEILVEIDGGQITTGAKRNFLLSRAKGDYIAFIDDDDAVSGDYVGKILKAIKTRPDCCGMEGIISFKKRNESRLFIHSIQYKEWYEMDKVYYRCPNHLSPVKRELALQVGFPDRTVGEDRDYSMRLLPLLKTEVYINGPIYFYKTG